MPKTRVYRNRQGEGTGVRVPDVSSGIAGSTPATLPDSPEPKAKRKPAKKQPAKKAVAKKTP